MTSLDDTARILKRVPLEIVMEKIRNSLKNPVPENFTLEIMAENGWTYTEFMDAMKDRISHIKNKND